MAADDPRSSFFVLSSGRQRRRAPPESVGKLFGRGSVQRTVRDEALCEDREGIFVTTVFREFGSRINRIQPMFASVGLV
jgi:hypothetical protein